MAEIKKAEIVFSTGKQIPTNGNAISLWETLEIGWGMLMPSIFSLSSAKINGCHYPENPYQLTETELIELSDLMISQWVELKENIKRYGIESPKLFKEKTKS